MYINDDAAERNPLAEGQLDLESNPFPNGYLGQRLDVTTAQANVANARGVLFAGIALPFDLQRQRHALCASAVLRRIFPWFHCLVFSPRNKSRAKPDSIRGEAAV